MSWAGLGWPVESVRARGLGWPVVRLVCVCPAGCARCGRVVVSRVCFRSPVGVAGLEPAASSSRTKRATKLRHTPKNRETNFSFPLFSSVFFVGFNRITLTRHRQNPSRMWDSNPQHLVYKTSTLPVELIRPNRASLTITREGRERQEEMQETRLPPVCPVGVEPTRPKALEPKSSASASSATDTLQLGSPGGHLAAMEAQ